MRTVVLTCVCMMVLVLLTSGGNVDNKGLMYPCGSMKRKYLGVEVPGTFTHQQTHLHNLCWSLYSGGNADNSCQKEPCSSLKST